MRYRVRTPEGELEYESILHVEQAYIAGLVEPDDEVLEEGGTLWRKAASIPNLARARRTTSQKKPSSNKQRLTIAVSVALAVVALLLVQSGRGLFGLLIALVVASLLWRVTSQAFRPKR